MNEYRYVACGAVLVDGDRVLVLRRPSRGEVRLPKGHIEPQETPQEAAVRELFEEAGYSYVLVKADLGEQLVEFDHDGGHFVRTERYFLMTPSERSRGQIGPGEPEFEPAWLSWEEALAQLSFEGEKVWVRRAHEHFK